jgi:hypothetical protein
MEYLDVRMQFQWKGSTLIFHLTIRQFERHTGANIFQGLFLNPEMRFGFLGQASNLT